ncbi:hypothetical protein [Aeromicrobium sp.]|jgi:hypothetical protein|uniref:hypothetical protein n=1 Tax=Aeromicrobium sp. TaxID=1871063 RepID=UPI0025B9430E|nr:hypothetical protein [Aeromicrobium sp.]MCK5890258.1 hypothetical protein [Aeromicrobium sp.]
MTILSDALIRAEAAESAAADLMMRLSVVRSEILELERLRGPGDARQHVLDRAADTRRDLGDPLSSITLSIRSALDATESAYFGGAVSGEIDVARARTMIGVALQSAREVRHLQLAIKDTADAMRDVAADPSGDLETRRKLPRSLQHASTPLEQAQRGAYRAHEDLVMISRSLSVDVARLVGDRVEAGAEIPPDHGPVARVEPARQAVVDRERLPHHLDADHAELIEIESLARQRGSCLLLVDRAEDLRRSLRGQRREQAQGMRDALHQAETLLLEKATAGEIDSGTARSMTAIALQAAKEVRHLQLDLEDVVDLLMPLAQSSPNGALTREVSRGIVAANTGLDRARRSALRVFSDLQVLARSIVSQHERPVALALVFSDEVELLTPARTGQARTRLGDPMLAISRSAHPTGFDR